MASAHSHSIDLSKIRSLMRVGLGGAFFRNTLLRIEFGSKNSDNRDDISNALSKLEKIRMALHELALERATISSTFRNATGIPSKKTNI
jgi:hypothetical protein